MTDIMIAMLSMVLAISLGGISYKLGQIVEILRKKS